MSTSTEIYKINKLNNNWVLWAHLPHDTNWSLDSYKKISNINYIEEYIELYKNIPDTMILKCMLFTMKEGIKPMWEDINNINGGCFSYKVLDTNIINTWTTLNYMLLGETLMKDEKLSQYINGISISPKKNFSIVKIWLNTSEYQSSDIINNIEPHIVSNCCIFKKHEMK
jgi:hypothetical protein